MVAFLGQGADGVDVGQRPGEVAPVDHPHERVALAHPLAAREPGFDGGIVEEFHYLPSMADVEEVVDEWLAEEFELAPTAASGLGLTRFDDRLGDFSAATFEAEGHRTRSWAARFAEVEAANLPLDDRIDVALVLTELAGRAVLEDWATWRREPATYLDPCLEGLFSLFLNRLRPEAELAAAAVARLGEVPAVLAAGQANLDADLTPPLFVRRALGACRAGAGWMRDSLPAEIGDDRLRADVADAAVGAADALATFGDFLERLGERAQGDWKLGEPRYSDILRQRELLGYGAAELHERGVAASAQLDGEMTELAARIDPNAGGWLPVVESLAADHPATPEEMLADYQQSCGRARAFLEERHLVTLPEGERCEVVPSPPFQRPILAVASYHAPPPLSGSRVGYFFVPYPPDGVSARDRDERLADNGYHLVPSVSVHEAYPGHHWQLAWSAHTPRPVRHWVRTSYFVEGWALYAEQMMREEGYFVDPRQELYQLDMRLFRAARIVVDSALHTGDMSPEAAVDHLRAKVGMPEAVARAEVDRYSAWPTQAASYLTGALEIERIRDRWRAGPGAGRPLREFHDTIGASPGLPLALAELSVLGAAPPA